VVASRWHDAAPPAALAVLAAAALVPAGLLVTSVAAVALIVAVLSAVMIICNGVVGLCLTVPAVVAASVWLDLPLVLGLEAKDMSLLALTFVVGAITLASGRTNLMQGAVHLVIFASFLFLALVP
jgi:Ca2+:H+ antiporter